MRSYCVLDAMRLLSMSRSVIYQQLRSGRLESLVQGRTRLNAPRSTTAKIHLDSADLRRRSGRRQSPLGSLRACRSLTRRWDVFRDGDACCAGEVVEIV
jgi:hypothetical protein